MLMAKKNRPILLSLISLLEMLVGILIILTGGFFVILSLGLLGNEFDTLLEETFAGAFGIVLTALAGAFLFTGFLIFLLGHGLWKLNSVAWFISTILYGLAFLNILLNYESYLSIIKAGSYNELMTPIVTVFLLFYFLKIRDRFS